MKHYRLLIHIITMIVDSLRLPVPLISSCIGGFKWKKLENTSFSFEVSTKGWLKVPKVDRSRKAKQYFRNAFISSLLFLLVMQKEGRHCFYTKIAAKATDFNTDVIETLFLEASIYQIFTSWFWYVRKGGMCKWSWKPLTVDKPNW